MVYAEFGICEQFGNCILSIIGMGMLVNLTKLSSGVGKNKVQVYEQMLNITKHGSIEYYQGS